MAMDPHPEISPVMTADEVADLLGVDRKSVYAAARRNEIPHRRLGRRYLFSRQAILRWLGSDLPVRA